MLRPIDYILQPAEGWYWLQNAPREFWWWLTSERGLGGWDEPPEHYPSRAAVLRRFGRNIVDPRYWWSCIKYREWPWGGLLEALRWE